MTWNEEVKFGPPTPKKMRTVSPTLHKRVGLRQRADGAVEQEILGPLGDQLLVVHLLITLRTERLRRVELALHDVEFAVDQWQPAFRLDKKQGRTCRW